MSKKNILYIKNNYLNENLSKNFDKLEKCFNVNFTWINSTSLINKNDNDLNNYIESYDIIILGGGPQHIIETCLDSYPEITNQIQLVKMISKTNKLLIGICLGCQIIGKAFGFNIIKMDTLCLGFDYLKSDSIDYDFIKKKKDKYLLKLDFNLLSNSFSHHYDCIDINSINYNNNNNELICIGYSKLDIPYILTHSKANIYGFQFHPELDIECIIKILNNYPRDSKKINLEKFNPEVFFHFFDIFINS